MHKHVQRSSPTLARTLQLFAPLAMLFVLFAAVLPISVAAAPGAVDTTFNLGSGPNNIVNALVVQGDGKIVIAGVFTNVHGTPRGGIARLNANGSLDTSFDPSGGANVDVNALALQGDGNLMIGGYFTSVNGMPRNFIARLIGKPTAAPELAVVGNSEPIADGDTSPAIANNTDFGGVALGQSATHTFTISNTGTAPLNLTGTPKVSISGAAASDFAVVSEPTTLVAASGNTTFQVRFAPSAASTSSATISIANDDGDENPYDFAIQGQGLAPGYGSSPVQSSTINVGSATIGSPVSTNLSISETGDATLNLTSHSLSGANTGDFSVSPANLSIADGAQRRT